MSDLFQHIRSNIDNVKVSDYIELAIRQSYTTQWIIDQIVERLYNFGLDADGMKLRTDRGQSSGRFKGVKGYYAGRTEKTKTKKNQPIDRVTLNDTGEFYSSFDVETDDKSFMVVADFLKDGNHIQANFQDSYIDSDAMEQAIVALNEKELNELLHLIIKPIVIHNLKLQILKR